MPVACGATSTLVGSDGMFAYKPAGTELCLLDNSDFVVLDSKIKLSPGHGFMSGDPVSFKAEGGKLDTGITETKTYYLGAVTGIDAVLLDAKGGTPVVLKGDGGVAVAALLATPASGGVPSAVVPTGVLPTTIGGYGAGPYTDVATTAVTGTGTGLTVTATVSPGGGGGVPSALSTFLPALPTTAAGYGAGPYKAIATTTSIKSGAGTGLTVDATVTSVAASGGVPATLGAFTPVLPTTGAKYGAGPYTAIATTTKTGTGTGLTVDVTVAASEVTAIAIGTVAGAGYAANDTVTVLGTALGGASPADDIEIVIATASPVVPATNAISAIAIGTAAGTGYVAGDTVTVPGTALGGASPANDIVATIGAASAIVLANVTAIALGTTAGTGYAVGDEVKILGTDLGGPSPANDITLKIDAATPIIPAVLPRPATAKDTEGGHIKVSFADYEAVCQIAGFDINMTRDKIPTTSLKCSVAGAAGSTVLFKKYQAGPADGSGTLRVQFTASTAGLASRMLADSMKASQMGAWGKFFINAVAGSVATDVLPDDSLSSYIEVPLTLEGISLSVDSAGTEATVATVNFSFAGAPTHLFTTAIG